MELFNIHLVEDDMDDVELIKEMLSCNENYKFNVETSQRIIDAEVKLRNRSPDLILLDLSLPDGSGLELVSRLKEIVPASDLIILTGNNDEAIGIDALKLGASDYLIKGRIDAPTLVRTIIFSRQRRKLEMQLRQSQKVEAIGQLAGGIAHDLNNQIGIMYLLLNEMRSMTNNVEINKPLSQLNIIIEKCERMTRQILAFSRKQSLTLEVFEINSFLGHLIPFIERLVGSTIEIEFSPDKENCFAKLDKIGFEQIIWNLIINARDALEGTGRIGIRTQIKVENDSKFVLIEIKDNGPGIPQDVIGKIFDPFFTTKPRDIGTGLGLSTVMGIVKQSRGSISLESELGAGATFSITFPYSSEPPKAAQAEAKKTTIPVNCSVLLCDDELQLLELTAGVLEAKGVKIYKANSGEEGLKIFEEFQDKIDLVITDLTMPKMSGLQMVEEILKVKPELKVILISGFLQDVANHSSVAKNLKVLQKPYTSENLISKVSEMF